MTATDRLSDYELDICDEIKADRDARDVGRPSSCSAFAITRFLVVVVVVVVWLVYCRHVCETCRCPRADHDVISDDITDAYDRLGLSISTDPRQASRDLAGKLGYTWLPLGLHKQKVCCEFYSTHHKRTQYSTRAK